MKEMTPAKRVTGRQKFFFRNEEGRRKRSERKIALWFLF